MKQRVIRLPACPVPDYHPRTRPMAAVALLAALGSLASCTTLGTNIRGSFSCGAAVGGSCAPATVIDDKALAEITGDVSFRPAGPYRAPARQIVPQRVAYAADSAAEPTPQKVLRIVFPAHVDALGRFHETAIVQAIVDNGQWVAATNGHGPGLTASNTLNVSPEILSQLGSAITSGGDRPAPPEPAAMSAPDVRMPSVAAVAAARAKARSPSPTVSGVSDDALPSTTSAARSDTTAGSVAAPANRPRAFAPSVEN